MLQINRVKVVIATENGIYGSDTSFSAGLNFLSSSENTCGKSSILAAVYYCLGLEEIIGGRGEKVLTSVFKTALEADGKVWSVLESGAYLEISNGNNIVTLYRSAKMQNRDSRMITIFYSDMENIHNPKTVTVDTYVHFPNAANNKKGFHSFLEKFLYLDLPLVTASDDSQRKLYLQLIFSCMFIEQKHGWSDLFSGMPILGIKESKKRVIEYILKLDTLDNEKRKYQLNAEEASIQKDWETCYNSLLVTANRESCSVLNFPLRPKLLTEIDTARISLKKGNFLITDLIPQLVHDASELKKLKPKVIDNFEELQHELRETEDSISELTQFMSKLRTEIFHESGSIKSIDQSLETVAIDLANNKDAARLRKLGSELQCSFSNDICPVCHQSINDSLLPHTIQVSVMGIDENIRHLEAQQDMLKFALSSHVQRKKDLEAELQHSQAKLLTLQRLAQSIRNDLFTINEDYSEAVIYKKISLEKEIDALNSLYAVLNETVSSLEALSTRWKNYLDAKKQLPKDKFTVSDRDKIESLRKAFINNLRLFGYKSIQNLEEITISEESYLPLFEGFDMKFDSSASDNIRVIWAFTLALLQVSNEKNGNHPCVLIFDEPDQQSTIVTDMQAFFQRILMLNNNSQVIMGITLKDSDTRKVIKDLPTDSYRQIEVPNKAFQFISPLSKAN